MAGDEENTSPKDASTTPSDSAKARLAQVSEHIAPNTPKRRRRKAADSDLPADYSDILGQIATLRKSAATPDTSNRGYLRQKQAGKLWVRERVDQLLDEGSFQEVGSVSGTVKWKQLGPLKEEPEEYVPSNNVQGLLLCGFFLAPDADISQVLENCEVEKLFLRQMTFQYVLGMLMVR
jgi:hypothetical protein